MENNLPVMAKRVWSIARVVYYMLRKGISKGKLMLDLNIFLKRRTKLAGKAIANLISLHHHHAAAASSPDAAAAHLQFSAARGEYEFSCSNTPNNYLHNFFPTKHNRHSHFFACAHAPLTLDDDVAGVNNALRVTLEMLENNKGKSVVEAAAASPALPGFGRTPMARQLRVTDSPFPVQDGDEDRDHQVDKAAEEFIKRFYKELRKQA
ncbi:uncharacterized protein G2W53_000300 [Senna tora]|uniref:Avr9/Cf-9 rapidly elicited protein 146 n=1 Tax=Senna tora TaxID=362788 RepID=A0A834XF98_9FABA|nr:uncharacterized protein G2W53_000300 [Senna tora]